ncbi:fibronectin type III domain-containing protein [Microbacterium sp. ZW T5_45]|uniref:fibronectin type III domain-containing protein n=1 Tax=Microbacterium sp. ZW T5_45 TaxID=3378080 RepID=UPI003852C58E
MPPTTVPARAHRAPRFRPGSRTAALFGGLTALTLVAFPAAASAAAGVGVSTPATAIAYTEQSDPVLVGEDITVTGGSAYGGGYIDFTVDDATGDDVLSLLTAQVADTTTGAVSIVGDTVYIGTGSRAEVIGAVDPARNGADGTLRVTFTSPFANPSFEGSEEIEGWTVLNDRVDLGVTEIAGFTSIDRSTYAGLNPGFPAEYAPGNDDDAPFQATYSVNLNSADASDGGHSLELSSSMTTMGSCDVVHGPAVYSDPFTAAANDKIYFDWRAYYGADNYHVFGYILNTVTGEQTTVLDATGGDNSAFQTKETTIPASGTYRFVFVGGTHDLSCGMAAGARLLIDNVRVYGSKVTDEVVTSIGNKLRYASTSDDPASSRTVAITVADQGGSETASGEVEIDITAVDDAPALVAVAPISFVNSEGVDDYAPSEGTLTATDPDSDEISHRILGDHAEAATIDGQSYTHARTGRFGTLHIDEQTGRYVFVPDAAAADAQQTDDTEEFVFEVSSTDERSGAANPPVLTARQTLAVSLQVTAGAPGAPTSTEVVAGAESAVVSWRAPAWIGGSDITGYRIEQSLDGGESWTEAVADTGSADTSYAVMGLPVGVPAQFRVSAINVNGTGPAGEPSAAVTAYTTPGAPTLQHVLPSNGALTVLFTPSEDDGGAEVTGYEYSLDGGETWTPTSSSPLTITGLRNDVAYDVLLRAVNAAGDGESVTATGTPALAPIHFLDQDGTPVLPVQPSGAVAATLAGAETPVEVAAQGSDTVVTGDGFEVRASSLDPAGAQVALRDGVLEAVQGGSLVVSGEGYLPGSVVDLWLLESNLFLGQVTVGDDGTFSTRVAVPTDAALGADTLQVNGLSASGEVRSVALGVVVIAPAAAVFAPEAATPAAGGLATTGGELSLGLAGLSAVLLAAGAVFLLSRRRADRTVSQG